MINVVDEELELPPSLMTTISSFLIALVVDKLLPDRRTGVG
jgi:hypothetical protein